VTVVTNGETPRVETSPMKVRLASVVARKFFISATVRRENAGWRQLKLVSSNHAPNETHRIVIGSIHRGLK
jgi:hypothetical protein